MNLQKGKHTPGTHNNQQTRAQYNNNSRIQSSLPVTHLGQVQRTDDFLRQGSGYSQQISGLHHYSVAPVASVSGSPHDMSKQAALPSQAQNNQGLYSNPSGVAGAGNQPSQQQPSTMPSATAVPPPHPGTPGPRPPAPGVVHHQQPQLQPRNFYQHQHRSVVRPYTWNTTSAMNHAAQQPQNQYQNPVWFQHQFQNMQHTHMMRSQAPNPMQIFNPQYPSTTQYPNVQASAQQQIMYNHGTPGNPGGQFVYSHQRPATAFYPAQVPQIPAPFNPTVIYQNPRPGIPNAQPPPSQASKGKSIICIQDPTTMQDVTENILYGGEQNSSNQSGSEPPSRKDSVSSEPSTQNQNSDVKIEFAAKVASVATTIVPNRQEAVPEKPTLPLNMPPMGPQGIRLDNMNIPVYNPCVMPDGGGILVSAAPPLPSNVVVKLDNAAHPKRFMTDNGPPPARPNHLENINPIQLSPCRPEDLTPTTRQLLSHQRPSSSADTHSGDAFDNGQQQVEEHISVYELGEPIDQVSFESQSEVAALQKEPEVAPSIQVTTTPAAVVIPPLLTRNEAAADAVVIPTNLPPLAEKVVGDAYPVKVTDHGGVPMTNSSSSSASYVSVLDNNKVSGSKAGAAVISEPMQTKLVTVEPSESVIVTKPPPVPFSSKTESGTVPPPEVPPPPPSSEIRTSPINVQATGPAKGDQQQLKYTSVVVSSSDKVLSPREQQLPVDKTISPIEAQVATTQSEALAVSVASEVTVSDSPVPQQNGDAREGVSSPPQDSKDSEAREGKKNRKKKMKELNRKGESKDGGEMDAFVDREEEPTSLPASTGPVLPDTTTNTTALKTPSPPPVISTSAPSVVVVDVVTTTPAVVPDPEQEDVTEEERKVAEKNEENKRVSQKAISEPTPVIEPPKPELPKYQYKEDQWSPLNPEGKKQYDRAFLITLQSKPMSMQKPKGLPNLDVIKDTALQHKLPDLNRPAAPPLAGQTPAIHRNQHHDLFMPQYARSGGGGSPRPPQGGINRRQSQQGREKPKKIISFSSSLNEDVKLHEASNAWKPHKAMTQAELNEEEKKTEELYRRVRGILNKLTPQKFKTLLEQVAELPIDTEYRLKGVIDLVFEKAVDEPNFSVPYANMCKYLMMKAVPSDADKTNVNFRKLLLTKCQREFEKDIKDEINRDNRIKQIEEASEEDKKKMKEELDEEERKVRRRCLGNIRFIGELYKLGMLTANIMHDCLSKLLKQGDEDSLECLCRLMTTIGKELDDNAKQSEKNQHKQYSLLNKMDGYFKTMKQIVEGRNTSSRVRFMLQDVMDLRLRDWVPRREDNNPKTIEQIHFEAQREAEMQQIQAQQPLQHTLPKRVDDRDRRKNRSMQGYSGEDGGWNTVGGGKTRSTFNSFDPGKIPPKITRPVEAESIQLGPGGRGFSSWSRGSSGGGSSKTLNQEPEIKTPSNRFSALMNQEQNEPRRMLQHSSSSSREPSRGRQGPPQSSQLRNKIPSQTNTRERESAIATVVAFQQSSVESPKPPEISTPKPIEVEEVSVTPAPVPVASEYISTGKEMSIDEMETKTKPLIDEFCHTSDFKEAVQCVVELVSPTTVHMFVNCAINLVLERSSQAQTMLGQLLKMLVHKNVISLAQYIEGLQATLEISEDLAIDVPKIWSCLGGVIAPMVQDGSMSMAFLKDALKPFVENGVAARIMPELLHNVANVHGPKRVQELWNNSGLKWSYFLNSTVNEAQFITDKKLEFTTLQEVDPSQVKRVSPEEAKKQLDNLLCRKKPTNEDVFDWIEANIGEELIQTPPYIRALVTAVTESAITLTKGQHGIDIKIFKDRIMLLKKYLENKEDLEIQALYALQALVNKLQHPQGMLVQIFNTLYDEEAMSEDAFFQWERSNDPAEQEGKGVAIKSVTSFFLWLQEADEDSAEEN